MARGSKQKFNNDYDVILCVINVKYVAMKQLLIIDKEYPATFWHLLHRLTMLSNAFCVKTTGIFRHSLIIVAEIC